MIENLNIEYPKRIHNLLKDVNKLFKDKTYGAHKNIIGLTVPFMVLEKWREDGHASDIPLLDEAVKNVVMATATLLFGWTKTCCLHLRVALENVFTSNSLLMNSRALTAYNTNGMISYKRFKDSVNDFEKGSATFANISSKFGIKTDALNLYADLSNWSHTLGNDFVCDLSILGYSKMNNATIGKMKAHYQKLARISSIIYLSIKPNMFQDISPSNQRLFLSYISREERKMFREMIGL